MHLSHSLARWSLEVNIDKYHHLISVCLLGLTVFEKMQCQNNTDNQIIMNEGNKCLPPSLITLPPHFAPKQIFAGWSKKKKLRFARCFKYFAPPWQKPPLSYSSNYIIMYSFFFPMLQAVWHLLLSKPILQTCNSK